MGGVFGKKKQASRVTEHDKAVLVSKVSLKCYLEFCKILFTKL